MKNVLFFVIITQKKISMEILKFKNCIVNTLGTSPPLPPECDALKET